MKNLIIIGMLFISACNSNSVESEKINSENDTTLSGVEENPAPTFDTALESQPEPAAIDISGTHGLTLQWLSFENNDRGLATIRETKNPKIFRVLGEQRNEAGYISIDGLLTVIDPLELQFDGIIEYLVKNAGRDTCRKLGVQQFLSTKNRKYWRLQDMSSCGSTDTDYVDLYF